MDTLYFQNLLNKRKYRMENKSDTNYIANQCKIESQPVKTESQPSTFVQSQEQKEMKDTESTVNTASNENDLSETKEYADLLLKLRSSDSGDIALNRESNVDVYLGKLLVVINFNEFYHTIKYNSKFTRYRSF